MRNTHPKTAKQINVQITAMCTLCNNHQLGHTLTYEGKRKKVQIIGEVDSAPRQNASAKPE